MKISKSKQELARIISENGGWRDGAEFSAQDKDGEVFHYATKPTINAGREVWHHKGCIGEGEFTAETLPNWHQTILSRAEYFHLYPAPDAGGWIEWNGGDCPVDVGTIVDVKHRDGDIGIRCHAGMSSSEPDGDGPATAEDWSHLDEGGDIIAYRLHKPEQVKSEFCESVTRSIPEPDEQVWTNLPTIEQLAADYRNKLDYANRKQDEADKANMESDAALSQLEDAIAAIGFAITPLAATDKEPELVITDWRDLQVGDEICTISGEVVTVTGFDKGNNEWPVLAVAKSGGDWIVGKNGFTFIRRP